MSSRPGFRRSPSLFFIHLAILLLPGVLWARVDAVYGTKKGQSQFEFAVRAMLFGLTSYALTYLAFVMWGASFEVMDLARAAKDSILTRGIVIQVGVAMAVGFLASILWLYVVNYKLLTRLLQMIGASKTYGDEDVWDKPSTRTAPLSNSPPAVSPGWDKKQRLPFAALGSSRSAVVTDKRRQQARAEASVVEYGGDHLFDIHGG